MTLTAETVIAAIGVLVALPPAILALLQCYSRRRTGHYQNETEQREFDALDTDATSIYVVTVQVEIRPRHVNRDSH
ncbi:hypothetical protein F4808DRAFT_437393 [Astrocystis sublimbata]|nr:hypothetical protein F4808DRAFT_437393 [Astrocystis sublimbata]